ncbi:MAG: L,D-transpeptidase family protein [Bacteroidota bacterium]|nr:L,D-transpeptidase family protein [Bacteroidota bacterium]
MPSIDAEAVAAGIRAILLPPEDTISPRKVLLSHPKLLYHFYRSRDFAPVWVQSFEPSSPMGKFLAVLEHVDEHGLDPAMYGSERISRLRSSFLSAPSAADSVLPLLDVAISDAAISLDTDLRAGVFAPMDLYPENFNLPVKPRRSSASVLAAVDIAEHFRTIAPRNGRYTSLQNALRLLRQMARGDTLETIPFPGGKIEPGQHATILGRIDRRIRFLRQLRLGGSPPLPENAFTSRYDAKGYTVYDSALVENVKEFQRNHGLLDDGVIGERTVKMLNMPLAERIRLVRLNLERCRWLNFPDTGSYVRINIPEFYLHAVHDDRTVERIKVCLGMRYTVVIRGHRPMNYQTPMTWGYISAIVLNPPWYVPPSIAARETYYAALKDSTYLRRHNYRIVRGDSVLRSGSIRLKEYDPNNLPFRFVQGPGEANALGRIKFVFDNPFGIYLHDTPKRKPFTYATRTVSHGCIRVEEPMRLLSFLLTPRDRWTLDSVRQYLDRTQATKTFSLARKTPIYIDYMTVWVDTDGVIQFRDDVYGKNRVLAHAFAALPGAKW